MFDTFTQKFPRDYTAAYTNYKVHTSLTISSISFLKKNKMWKKETH